METNEEQDGGLQPNNGQPVFKNGIIDFGTKNKKI